MSQSGRAGRHELRDDPPRLGSRGAAPGRNTVLVPVHVPPPGHDGEGPPRPGPERVPPRSRRRRWLRRVKWAVELALGVAAGILVYEQRDQIGASGQIFSQAHWQWLLAAVVFQAGSMVVFARLQRWLLRSGGVELGLAPMVEITLAGNSMSVSLPGGAAWAATFAYEQLRRRGADRTLAGWVILVAGALSSLALFVIFAAGVELAGGHGPVAGLRVGVLVVAAIPAGALVLAVAVHRSRAARRLTSRATAAAAAAAEARLPRGDQVVRALTTVSRRLQTVQPSAGVWGVSFGLALTNWLLDCATLFACIEALGLPLPWAGLLVAYSLAQISASLPITPGGIGVVEGSLTFALVAYGMTGKAAVASALLYRIVSFWGLVPIGWSAWVYLELRQRRGGRGGRHHPWAWHQDSEGGDPGSSGGSGGSGGSEPSEVAS